MSRRLKNSLLALAACAALALALAAGASWFARNPAAPVASFAVVREGYRSSEGKLLDRNGALLHELRVDNQGRRLAWTPLAAVSPALVRAVLASEDRRFYRHRGVDGLALARAALGALTGRNRGGASTLSMQLPGLVDSEGNRRPPRRSLPEKVAQLRRALALEKSWSKSQILEAYLNLVTFRGELRGISAASRGLFSKDPSGLDGAEAALLAALVRSPNAPAPAVAHRAFRLARGLGEDSDEARFQALARETLERPPSVVPPVALAPHVARLLLGASTVTVRSTLDGALQRFAANALARQAFSLRDRRVGDGAVLAVANRTGEVLAYVGNLGASSTAPWVDGVRAPRQAGSTLKPFLYGLALEEKLLTAASLLDDSPLDVPTERGTFSPRNYDRRFRGLVPLRTALASSLNIPAVRTLLLLGPDAFAGRLRLAGFSRVRTGEEHGVALALGGADVTLWELVAAYRALAAGGLWSPLTLAADAPTERARRVLSREAAFVVADVLSDRGAREETFGLESVLATPFWSAVKTGTSKDMRDNWCVGFSRDYTVGVWVGNFSGEPMGNVSGMTGAAPVWSEVMDWLHRPGAGAPSAPPPGMVRRHIRFPRDLAAERDEWFLAGTEPAGGGLTLGSAPSPTLRFPSPGLTLALDPDIPDERQRVYFEARNAATGYRYLLDGHDAGSAAGPAAWRPEPGPHVLALVDGEGRTVDEAPFTVSPALPLSGRPAEKTVER